MDPMTQFLDMLKGNGTAATPPQTMSPATTPGMMTDPATAAAVAAAGGIGAPAIAVKKTPGLGDILGAIKMPEQKAQFSGGVTGMQLPTRTALQNTISPAMQQLTNPGLMPTLGALLSQAPGGGR
jgi:hypothetical protein